MNPEKKAKAIAGCLGMVLGAGICVLLDVVQWFVHCWAVPQLWPTGPANLTRPPFLLFIATMYLIRNLMRAKVRILWPPDQAFEDGPK